MVVEHGYAHCVSRSCIRCVDYRRGAEDGRNKALLDLVKLDTQGHPDGCKCELHQVTATVVRNQLLLRARTERPGPRDADPS